MPGPVASEPPPGPASRGGRGARGKVRGSVVALVGSAVVVAVIAVAIFDGSAKTVIDPVAQAATVSSSAAGYQLHMSMQISSGAASAPITATGAGTFDLRDHTGSITMALNLGNDPQITQTLGSSTLKMQEIVNGTTIYIKLPAAVASVLPTSGKQWIAIDLSKLAGIPGLSSLTSNPASSNPADMLEYLRAASNSIAAVGHEEVDGFETTHYRAELSLDRAMNDVPAADRAAAQQALSKIEQLTQVHEIPVDVWIDADHLVRRFEMNFGASPAGAPTVNERMTIDISHYGPEPRPALPPAGDVASLNGLIGSGG
jgi:hypothetical protein